MATYETIFVLDPSLEEHGMQKEIQRIEELITGRQGRIVKTEKWGLKKFAYPIKKKLQGFYTLIYFEGDGNLPSELERFYKLNEFCLRYLTVVSEGKAQPEEQDQKQEESQADSSSSE